MGDRGTASRCRRPRLQDCRPHLLRLRHQGEYRLENNPRPRMAAIRADLPGAGRERDRSGLGRVCGRQGSDRAARSSRRQGCPARGNRRRNRACRNAGGGRGDDRRSAARGPTRAHLPLYQLRHGPDGSARRDRQTACVDRRRRARPRPVQLRKPVKRPGPPQQR